jgi:hypothetical protein
MFSKSAKARESLASGSRGFPKAKTGNGEVTLSVGRE